jgi:hypothetical protein
MPIPLPQLDDRTWKDLVDESLSLIPSLTREWTDFNASDPGITLIELLAYHTESLLYRVNRISDPSRCAFLKLIHGPAWQSHGDLDRDIRNTLAGLRHCRRAVTSRDFESLAMAVNGQREYQEKVARARCLPRRNLEGDGKASLDTPGHVTVLILPTTGSPPSDELRRRVRAMLEPARLITTRVHIVAPRFVAISVSITLVIEKDAAPQAVRAAAIAALENFFDPLTGGPDGTGWPFGRDVYLSEVYRILAHLPGVRYVTRSIDSATQKPVEELAAPEADGSRWIRNQAGELEAVDLHADELVKAKLTAAAIEVKYQNL